MLTDLPLDILIIIFLQFNKLTNLIKIIKLNKYFYYNIDDSFFLIWGENKYSKNFWIKANNRSKCISKPLNSMKLELIRLERFINSLEIQNIRWNNSDFYKLWNVLEELKQKKDKTTKNYLFTNLSIQQ